MYARIYLRPGSFLCARVNCNNGRMQNRCRRFPRSNVARITRGLTGNEIAPGASAKLRSARWNPATGGGRLRALVDERDRYAGIIPAFCRRYNYRLAGNLSRCVRMRFVISVVALHVRSMVIYALSL